MPEGKLVFNPSTRHLKYEPVLPIKDRAGAALAAIVTYLESNGPSSQAKIEAMRRPKDVTRGGIRVALQEQRDLAVSDRVLGEVDGPRNSKIWSLVPARSDSPNP